LRFVHTSSLGHSTDKLTVYVIDQGLKDLFALRRQRLKRRADILVHSALDIVPLDADFFHQLFDIIELHDNTDGARQGAWIGDNLFAGTRDIIAS
jgi:hypothetical protein